MTRTRVISLVALLHFLTWSSCMAQLFSDAQGKMRYSGRLLSLYAGGGVSWYSGEFAGSVGVPHVALGGAYSVFPELSVGVNADLGRVRYERAATETDLELYRWQFGDDAAARRGTNYYSFDLSVTANLLPRAYATILLSAGLGLTVYRADDHVDRSARVQPRADFPSHITLPLSVAGEFFLSRSLSAVLRLRHNLLFGSAFDAYDPEEVADAWRVAQGGGSIAMPEATGHDAYSSVSLTFHAYVYESDDYDGDLLPNRDEESLGTDPYNVDTDIDGLSDFDEVRVHTTNPLKEDTDDDGLGDYFEITKYGTNPLEADSDTDQLTDSEEVFIYKTDPNDPDTDDDVLSDYEEVIVFRTNPLNPDTDYDGLDDYAEVKVHKTNPLSSDTDSDGIYDFNEITTYRTSPTDPDTDRDRLEDYEEIVVYGTNPLNPDTDEDSVGDADELFVTQTNPLVHNSLEEAALPLAAVESGREVQLLETRTLPGGGTSYLLVPRSESTLPLSKADSSSRAPSPDSSGAGFVQRSVRALVPAQTSPSRALRLDTLTLHAGDMLSFCNITFEFNRDEIRPEYVPLLREALVVFRRYPGMRVEIRGHTDAEGGEEYNQQLSERRAETVRRFLETRGVDTGRLQTRGFGEREPLEIGSSEEIRARNRRVELYILTLDEQ